MLFVVFRNCIELLGVTLTWHHCSLRSEYSHALCKASFVVVAHVWSLLHVAKLSVVEWMRFGQARFVNAY